MNAWLWLGGSLSFESATLDWQDIETGAIESSKIKAVPIMAVAKATWLRKPHFSLYSKLGIGVMPVSIGGDLNKIKMSVQLSPIGMEFGGNHVFGFVEGGAGLQGVLIAGMRFFF